MDSSNLDPNLIYPGIIHGSLDPHESAPQMASRSVPTQTMLARVKGRQRLFLWESCGGQRKDKDSAMNFLHCFDTVDWMT